MISFNAVFERGGLVLAAGICGAWEVILEAGFRAGRQAFGGRTLFFLILGGVLFGRELFIYQQPGSAEYNGDSENNYSRYIFFCSKRVSSHGAGYNGGGSGLVR